MIWMCVRRGILDKEKQISDNRTRAILHKDQRRIWSHHRRFVTGVAGSGRSGRGGMDSSAGRFALVGSWTDDVPEDETPSRAVEARQPAQKEVILCV